LTFRKRHIALLALTIGLAFLFHAFLKSIYKDTIEIDFYVKTFGNAELQLFYQDGNQPFDIEKSNKNLLNASQFHKNTPFLVPDAANTRRLRMDFGDRKNTFIIDRVELIIKSIGERDTIRVWKGSELLELIDRPNDMVVEAANISFVQLKAGSEDPYLVLSNAIFKTLSARYDSSNSHDAQKAYVLLSAILLALVGSVSIGFVWTKISVPSLRTMLVNGQGFIFVTGAIIFLIYANNKLSFLPDKKSHENRSFKTLPELTLDNFFEFPDLYSDYARDNFSFRNLLFYLGANLKVKVFDASPLPKDVIVGHNKWMFDNEKGCVDDFRNLASVPQGELAFITHNLLQRKQWLDKRNIRFYVIIPPNKNRIYPELMPRAFFQTTQMGHNRLDLYTMHLKNHAGLNLIDPTDSLWSARHRKEVYYNTDTHWNLFGGFKGYQVLMREMAKDFPQLNPMSEDEFIIDSFFSNEGDLAKMISLQDIYKRKEYSFLFKDPGKQLPALNQSDIVIRFHNNKTVNGSTLKLLMFRDSYANYLIPFLNMHFKDATYVWSYEFLDKLIEEEKPDVVILESLQRFMPSAFLTPNPLLQ